MKEDVKPYTDHRKSSEQLSVHETILIVEDENAVLELMMKVLQQQGYQVLLASSSEDALNMVNDYNEPIDILLTDVVLPGMNGG